MGSSTSSPSRRESWLGLALCALALASTAGWSVPLRTFVSNAPEFQHGFGAYVSQLLGGSLLATAVLFGLGLLAPRRLAALYLALALCIWIQSSFLVWEYGVFDGKGIHWSDYSWQGWLDLAIWGGIIGLLQWQSHRLNRQLGWIAVLFVVLQLLSPFVEARMAKVDLAAAEPAPTEGMDEIAQLSSTRNVIHVLMDAFQTDVFFEVVGEDGLEDAFEGFTIFRDNLAPCAWTQLSLPSIFGGENYDGHVTTSEFLHDSLEQRAFPRELKSSGFRVSLVPFLDMQRVSHDAYLTSPRSYGKSQHEAMLDEQFLLLDVSLFRLSPHFARKWVYNHGDWRLSHIADPPTTRSFHQKAFLNDLTASLRVGDGQPRYLFTHLFPPHLPYVTNEDGSYAGKSLPNTRPNYKTEARFILRPVAELLRRLRQLGVYDDALIIVQGDHGSTHDPIFDGTPTGVGREGYAALLAIKPPGASGAFRVSEQPSMLADLPATVLGLLGLRAGDGPLFGAEMPADRTRHFFEPHWEENELEVFEIRGPVHDPASWSSLGRRRIGQEAAAYRWGDRVIFSMDGNAGLYLDTGWSYPDEGFIWNSGTEARMRFAVEPAAGDVHLYLTLRPFLVPGRKDEQRVGLVANGQPLVQWRLQGVPPLLHAVIPKALVQGPLLELAMRTPDAASPRELGVGYEDRKLAISVREMVLSEQPLDRR